MPYILKPEREKYKKDIYLLVNHEAQSDDIAALAAEKLVAKIKTAGDLNYVISSVVWQRLLKNKRYNTADRLMNDLGEVWYLLQLANFTVAASKIIGCSSRLGTIIHIVAKGVGKKLSINTAGTIACVKDEFYRRQIAVYEDEKIADPKNGDIV